MDMDINIYSSFIYKHHLYITSFLIYLKIEIIIFINTNVYHITTTYYA
jgi:hypothetical protein